mgnify:CR=1 FL=1
MIFYRIVDNKLHPIKETDTLGFEKSEGLRIPDEYLDKREFMVMRTAHGIGDWGILSAMPRLLKQKYPESKVYLPTPKLLNDLFKEYAGHWSVWNNPFDNVKTIFDNNPSNCFPGLAPPATLWPNKFKGMLPNLNPSVVPIPGSVFPKKCATT